MTKLSKKQVSALLTTIYHELTVLFEEMKDFKKFQDDPVRKKRILNDLSSILTNNLQCDLRDRSIFKLFDEIEK